MELKNKWFLTDLAEITYRAITQCLAKQCKNKSKLHCVLCELASQTSVLLDHSSITR